MDIRTRLPFNELSPWYFAVRWARMSLQQKVHDIKAQGLDHILDYDFQTLERLESLEAFLQVTWDDAIHNCVQTPAEVESNV
jgi:hypothetical protein